MSDPMTYREKPLPVRCPHCGVTVDSTYGFVPIDLEPDNHNAPCGIPCIGGGVTLDAIDIHDVGCPRCALN